MATEICIVCEGEIKVMTPPRKGICSENCLAIQRNKVIKKAHDTSRSPKPQLLTHKF